MCVLGVTLEDLNRYLWCRQWQPVYASAMHNAVCYDGTTGLAWITITQFIIVILAFVILMLRAAAYEVEDEEDIEERTRCMARCRSCCRSKSVVADEHSELVPQTGRIHTMKDAVEESDDG